VSTLIICAILFWFGQRLGASLIAGFALTLAIGVTLSMFSALTVSKTLLNLLNFSSLGRRRGVFSPERLPKASTAVVRATDDGGDS
jgi:preprotein translocase subunit SecD